MTRERKRTSGIVLVCVLVSMGIASAIVLGAVRSSLRARRQTQREVQLEQTRWLLEAGLVRALRQLRDQSDYAGEVWDTSDALAQYDQARVSIEVDREAASADTAQLILQARIGGDAAGEPATTRSRTVTVAIDSTESQQT